MSSRCEYITSTGKTCRLNKQNGTPYCNRHIVRKRAQVDLAKDEVFGVPEREKPIEPKKDKISYSSFKITINSQKDFSILSTDQKKLFKTFIEFIFNNDNISMFLTDQSNRDDPMKNIINIELDHYFEVGDSQHRLHAHGFINLEHKGYYRMDVKSIRELSKEILGYTIHIDNQASGNPIRSWENYIKKKQDSNVIELN